MTIIDDYGNVIGSACPRCGAHDADDNGRKDDLVLRCRACDEQWSPRLDAGEEDE